MIASKRKQEQKKGMDKFFNIIKTDSNESVRFTAGIHGRKATEIEITANLGMSNCNVKIAEDKGRIEYQ